MPNLPQALQKTIFENLALPVIAAPLFLVSNPKMCVACCAAGIVGSFPAHSTRTHEVLIDWLDEVADGLANLRSAGINPAPFAVNLVVHKTNARLDGDLQLIIDRKIPLVLTSKGAPGDVFAAIKAYGGTIFHDVANQRHAEKAIEAGADGVIAVADGAGGHCGTINPFALVGEIRQIFDGPIILAGAISTGRDILAAQTMGADLVYMGTRFITAQESSASEDYRQMVLASKATDIFFSAALDGAPANWLRPSLEAAGVDIDELRYRKPDAIIDTGKLKDRYKKIFLAGHGVGNIHNEESVADLVAHLREEYAHAKEYMRGLLA